MTNGPYARVAESVVIDIPRPRNRAEIIHDPGYYKIRNHLVEFLALRSKTLAGERSEDDGRKIPRRPVTVRPGLPGEASEEADNHLASRMEPELVSLAR